MTYSTDNNRLLLEIDKTIRELNRQAINPTIEMVKIEDLEPAMKLVARSRAEYLKELFDLASVVGDGLPSPDQVAHLRKLRLTFDELVAAAKALNTAIERGYLDVEK
jgi:cephalosporin hydroxylase